MSRRLLAVACLLLSFSSAHAAERWETLPPTPAPVVGAKTGYAAVNGIKVYYTRTGHGSPVVLLHGGLSNADYWGHQVKALAAKHTVISIDSRGHGRSSRDDRPYGYDLMADDVVAVLDSLNIPRADIVGWSDGAIIGIDLALRHPDRIGKVFAFAANTQTAGVKDGVEKPDLRRLYRTRRQGVRQAVTDAWGVRRVCRADQPYVGQPTELDRRAIAEHQDAYPDCRRRP